MSEHPMSFQLQWFETLRQIGADKNSTVIVPDNIMNGNIGTIGGTAAQALKQAEAKNLGVGGLFGGGAR